MATISINSNVSSLTAQRALTNASDSLSKSFERLSTGLRINRASDDAAGLAIADRLRVDTRLQGMAIRNINDGISLIHVASGTLENQGALLSRLVELAEQSANGSYSLTQRNSMNQEYQQLVAEFGRLGDSTKFNGLDLLRGTRGNLNSLLLQAGIDGGVNSALRVSSGDTGSFSGLVDSSTLVTGPSVPVPATIDELAAALNNNMSQIQVTDSNGVKHDVLLAWAATTFFSSPAVLFTPYIKASESNGTASSDPTKWVPTSGVSSILSYDGGTGKFNNQSVNLAIPNFTGNASGILSMDLTGFTMTSSSGGNGPSLGDTTALNTTGVESRTRAGRALDIIRNSITSISDLRGRYGALESRLLASLGVLSVSKENSAAAESRIRDTDVAAESSSLIATQIRQQIASSILGQANLGPKLALSLLQ